MMINVTRPFYSEYKPVVNRDLELRSCQTAAGNDHMTMFIFHLPLAVSSFSVKLSSFALASRARIVLHYSHPCTNMNLTLAILNLSHIPA